MRELVKIHFQINLLTIEISCFFPFSFNLSQTNSKYQLLL